MQRVALTLDLRDDPAAQAEYRDRHVRVPQAVEDDLRRSGIIAMDIYCLGSRLFMLLEAADDFSFAALAGREVDPEVLAWDRLMSTLQQPLPGSAPGSLWRQLDEVYTFRSEPPAQLE